MFGGKFLETVGAVLLAAGKGTRLNCVDCPKVMLEIGGKPIVWYAVDILKKIGFVKEHICLVVGFHKEKVMDYFGDEVSYAVQEEQKGTAHAAYVGIKTLPPCVRHVLVMNGDDSAFYTPDTLEMLLNRHISNNNTLTLLTAEINNPDSIGRVVRKESGEVIIVEKEHLSEEQKKIKRN
jgi:bifunctional UDP-N-acetylglucosamine pyrophosphorylase/glucosamine-1-phosphate N-acetyltransferase